jgi:hypothetical protein
MLVAVLFIATSLFTVVVANHLPVPRYKEYYLGGRNKNCNQVCTLQRLVCVQQMEPAEIMPAFRFFSASKNCVESSRDWWAQDQPCYVSDSNDPRGLQCLGVNNIPKAGPLCSGSHPAVKRLCRCIDQAAAAAAGCCGRGRGKGRGGGGEIRRIRPGRPRQKLQSSLPGADA